MDFLVEKSRDNNVMHTKPDLRVFLKWMIAGSGSVITDVIPLNPLQNHDGTDAISTSHTVCHNGVRCCRANIAADARQLLDGL